MSLINSSFYIQDDDTVKACGYNEYGQLGLGNNVNKNIPTIIPNLNNVKQISCGTYHTIFLLNDGTVKACGLNKYGQLCLGDNNDRNIPTVISNLDNVKPGDILRFGRPHSIMVTAVNGNEITYVDCNWVGKNTVKWNQKIQKDKMTGKWGSLQYVMQYPN